MAVIKLDMERDSDDVSRTASYYRPSEADFSSILDRLKAQRQRSAVYFSNSLNSLDEGNETTHEKQEKRRQEALQRDQYILSTRPNRHIVFAAKFAKIKNQGLAKRFEDQVHVWRQELKRNCRLVGASERKLEEELARVRTKEKPFKLPRLRVSYPGEGVKKSHKRHAKQHNNEIPRLERGKDESNAKYGPSSRKENDGTEKNECANTTIRLPPIQTKETHKDLFS